MSRLSKGARLCLEAETRKDGKLIRRARWVIRDGQLKRRTGCLEDDRKGAEHALAVYLARKLGAANPGRAERERRYREKNPEKVAEQWRRARERYSKKVRTWKAASVALRELGLEVEETEE
jgi:hypothetical protein